MKTKRLVKCVLLLMLGIWIFMAAAQSVAQEAEIPITTSSKEALKLYKQALDLSENLRAHESIQYFEKAIAKDPNFALAYLDLAITYFIEGNSKGFFDNFNKAAALVDKVSDGESLLIRAVQAAVNDNPTKQKELNLQLVKAYPKDKRAHQNLGSYYFSQLEYSAAIEEYKKAIEIAPDFAPAYNQLGYAYSFLSNHPEAEKALKKYAELIPDEPNPYDSLGEILMKEGKFDESIEAYQKALSINANFFMSYVGIGMDLVFKGKPDDGRKQFQKLYNIAPTDDQRRQALFSMMISYIDEGKFDNALEELKKRYAIVEKKKDLFAMVGDLGIMGEILLETGKLDEAKAKYLKACELIEKSNHSKEIKEDAKQNLLFNEAQVALKKKDFETAKSKAEEYRKQAAAGHNTLEMQIYHGLAGIIALYEKHFDDALKELKQANQRNPRNLFRIAKAYEGIGDKQKAKVMYKKAANFNEISYRYAFIRNKARKKLGEM